MSEVWRLVPWWQGTAGQVLAAGEVLLQGTASGAALHWYGFSPEALILGPRQRNAAAVDRQACRARGIGVYVRRSGGAAVLGDRALLNLDVALPAGHRLVTSDVTLSYGWLGEALAAGLRRLGVPAVTLSPAQVRAEAQVRGGAFSASAVACFGGLSPYEVVAEGRKVVGLSQVRRRQGALLQVGIPLAWDAAGLARLLGGEPLWRATLAAELHSVAAGLDRWEVDERRLHEVITVLTAQVAAAAGVTLHSQPWTPAEREQIDALAVERYAPLLPPGLPVHPGGA